MDSRFIRLTQHEAMWIKGNLKSSQASFENILGHLFSYNLMRKKEAILKNKLRASLSQLKSKLNSMEFTFPEEERRNAYNMIHEKERKHHHLIHNHQTEEHQIPHHLNHLHRMIQHEQSRNVDEELNNIKRKLERLQK